MKKIHAFVLVFLFLGLNACKQNLIEATQPKPAKNMKQAKARLVATPRWTIDELYLNDILVFANAKNIGDESIVELEWVSFKENGVFEVKIPNEPVDVSLRYKLDEQNNKLIIYESTNGEEFFENWTIEAGSVYSNSFEMTTTESEPGEEPLKLKLKMKTI